MPALMVLSSAALVALFAARPRAVDRRLPLAVGAEPRDLPVRDALGLRARTARPRGAAGWEAITVPGPDQPGDHRLRRSSRRSSTTLPDWLLLFAYVWLSASMLAAYLVRRLETLPLRRLARAPAALRRRLRAAAVRDHRRGLRRRAAARGDGVGEDREDRHRGGPGVSRLVSSFDAELEADERFERRLFWRQLAIVAGRRRADRAPGRCWASGRARGQPPDARSRSALAVVAGPLVALLPGPGARPAAVRHRLRAHAGAARASPRSAPCATARPRSCGCRSRYLGIVGADAPRGRRPVGRLPAARDPARGLARALRHAAPAADRARRRPRWCCWCRGR